MDAKKIARINELAKKSKASGLTSDELDEQKALRDEYRAAFRASLEAQLKMITVSDEPVSGEAS